MKQYTQPPRAVCSSRTYKRLVIPNIRSNNQKREIRHQHEIKNRFFARYCDYDASLSWGKKSRKSCSTNLQIGTFRSVTKEKSEINTRTYISAKIHSDSFCSFISRSVTAIQTFTFIILSKRFKFKCVNHCQGPITVPFAIKWS